MRRAWTLPAGRHAAALLVIGLGMAAVAARVAALEPGTIDWRRWRVPGTLFSHAALALIALGLADRAWRALLRLAPLPRLLARRLWTAMAAAAAIMAALIAARPEYASELMGREWGVVEPAQAVLYAAAAALAFAHARRRAGGPPAGLFRAVGVGAVVLALEEVDYFGLVTAAARLAGLPGARVAGHHVGGLHDLLNAAPGAPSAALVAAAIALAGAVVGWRARGWLPVVGRELRAPEARPLLIGALAMALAQAIDIDDAFFMARGLPSEKSVEEGAELLAAASLTAWLARALARTLAGAVTPGPPRPTDAGTGRPR